MTQFQVKTTKCSLCLAHPRQNVVVSSCRPEISPGLRSSRIERRFVRSAQPLVTRVDPCPLLVVSKTLLNPLNSVTKFTLLARFESQASASDIGVAGYVIHFSHQRYQPEHKFDLSGLF